MEYYSDAKKNKIKKIEDKCMKLETIILSEIGQVQKDIVPCSFSSMAPSFVSSDVSI